MCMKENEIENRNIKYKQEIVTLGKGERNYRKVGKWRKETQMRKRKKKTKKK